jgi:glycosyltransferase involved in cell wall biosynthesis
MKLLVVHNRYRQFGGEDSVFNLETSLLERAGHQVERLVVSNNDIISYRDKVQNAWSLPWNPHGYSLAEEAIRRIKPDIMHVHNLFALLTPAIYDAAAVANVPVVQTLHNFRTICANALLLRNNAPCELCIVGTPYNAVRFRCYRDSYFGSFALARMISYHQRKKTWRKVARFIALSEFSRSRFVAAGYPIEKIVVKPNSTVDPGVRGKSIGKAILFVGRLSEEKGIRTLVEAARIIDDPVRIVGDGPLRDELKITAPPNVTFIGHMSADEVRSEMSDARCLVIPSLWYENFPMTLAEAYAMALPVIASRLGALIELVDNEITGLHFTPGNATELAVAIKRLANDEADAARMGQAARQRYLERYTPDRALCDLETVYHSVIA